MQNPKNEAPAAEVGTQNQNPAPEQRTFTQADVDRIVGERLTREREKYEAETRKRAAVVNSRETWQKAGYSSESFDKLEMDEDGRIHIDRVLEFAGSLQKQIDALKAEKAERQKMPNFGGSVKGGAKIDRLAEAFKAPSKARSD